ncbi:MAG: hypothetical protein SVR94_06305 [Pseudomonadota bacterium]|nr:hypothetical protein [Pseudomonadota bacterium]
MAVTVHCQCGAHYNLKDEYRGKKLKCRQCNQSIEVPQLEVKAQSDSAFDRDKFLLKQKLISIAQKYYAFDEAGNKILFIRRPAHLLRNLFAVIAGFISGIIVAFLIGGLAGNEETAGFIGLLAMFAFIIVFFIVALLLYKKRHIEIYRDDSQQELLLHISQEQKIEFLNATFVLRDADNQVLARFRKNYIYNILRRRWYCYTPEGTLFCVAKEDSIILSLLRRFLGHFFGLLRTNFIILKGATTQVIGEFNRKYTLLDRYVLDMSADSTRDIDRRIALALGVLLDTGERR